MRQSDWMTVQAPLKVTYIPIIGIHTFTIGKRTSSKEGLELVSFVIKNQKIGIMSLWAQRVLLQFLLDSGINVGQSFPCHV